MTRITRVQVRSLPLKSPPLGRHKAPDVRIFFKNKRKRTPRPFGRRRFAKYRSRGSHDSRAATNEKMLRKSDTEQEEPSGRPKRSETRRAERTRRAAGRASRKAPRTGRWRRERQNLGTSGEFSPREARRTAGFCNRSALAYQKRWPTRSSTAF